MTDRIKLDYGLADEMIKTFQAGSKQLQDTQKEMLAIADMLDNGALLGRGGAAFSAALRTKLKDALGRLIAKYDELADDVRVAKEAMQTADREKARNRFV